MKRMLLGSLAFLGLCGGAALAQHGAHGVSAELRRADGHVVAHASATQAGEAVQVRIEATGLPAGTYGAHVHTTGRCEGPDFASAGAHWNPMGRQHGSENPQGPHMGDLPNLVVGADGHGSVAFEIPNAALHGGENAVLDQDGAAVVVHAAPDDYRTDPSGNSGARIACGALH